MEEEGGGGGGGGGHTQAHSQAPYTHMKRSQKRSQWFYSTVELLIFHVCIGCGEDYQDMESQCIETNKGLTNIHTLARTYTYTVEPP